MGTITDLVNAAFRDFWTDGVASSGLNEVDKSLVRSLGPMIEAAIANATLGALVDTTASTRALLDADLAHAANTVALVYADATDANNDLYVKTGASGSGAWTLTNALHQVIGAAGIVRARNSVPFLTWTGLAAASSMVAGDRASVIATDTGTHTDPVVGGTVNNSGVYQYSASPAGWRRMDDLDSTKALAAAPTTTSTAQPAGIEIHEDQDGMVSYAVQADGSLIIQDLRRPGNIAVYPQIDALQAAVAGLSSKTANTQALITAVRNNGFHIADTSRLASNDTPTLTIGADGAAPTITPNVSIPYTDSRISYIGGVPKNPKASYPWNAFFSGRGAYSGVGVDMVTPVLVPSVHGFEVVHTGTAMEVRVLGSGGGGLAQNIRVIVNGIDAGLTTIGGASSWLSYLKIAFPTSGTRRIQVITSNIPTANIVIGSSDTLAAGRTFPLVTFISDSFWDGSGADLPGGIQSTILARYLGVNCGLGAVGSTGMINPGTNNVVGNPKVPFADTARLPDYTMAGVISDQTGAAVSPAMGVVAASLNDSSVSSSLYLTYGATLRAAIRNRTLAMIDAFAAANPGKPQVFFGPTHHAGPPNNRPPIGTYDTRDGVAEACAMMATSNVWFIDRLHPHLREGVFSTTTDQAYLYTGGTDGTDATHPTPRGHVWDGLWMGRQLRDLILTKLA